MGAEALCHIEGLTRTRQDDHLFQLEVPHLSLRRGDRLGLFAPSGCGKSTLLNILALTLLPSQVDAFVYAIDDTVVDIKLAQSRSQDLSEFRARYIGYILQTGGLVPYLKVRENVALPLELLGIDGGDRVEELLDSLDIAHLRDRFPQQLSAGERQRVACARALVHKPQLILADEPTAALDQENARRCLDLLLAVAERQGATLVIATHNREHVRHIDLNHVEFRLEQGSKQKTTRFFLEPALEQ